jgi:hypothetical protein
MRAVHTADSKTREGSLFFAISFQKKKKINPKKCFIFSSWREERYK